MAYRWILYVIIKILIILIINEFLSACIGLYNSSNYKNCEIERGVLVKNCSSLKSLSYIYIIISILFIYLFIYLNENFWQKR